MFGRALVVCLLYGCLWLAESYTVPTPRITVLTPRGLRFEIDQSPDVTLIAYHYSINVPVPGILAGVYNFNAQLRDGLFFDENRLVTVNDGDTVHYWVYAIYSGLGYHLLDQQWTYRAPAGEPPRLPPTLPTPSLPRSSACPLPNCAVASVSPSPLAPAYGARSTPSSGPNSTNRDPGAASATTPTTAGNDVSTPAPTPSSGGLTTTTVILLTATIVCVVALTITLALFFTRRAKRFAKSQPPNVPTRPNHIGLNPPTAWAQQRSAENTNYEDPGYEDPDNMIANGADRGVAQGASWRQPSLQRTKGTRPKAPTPSPNEYEVRVTSMREVDGGYISPIAEQIEPLKASRAMAT